MEKGIIVNLEGAHAAETARVLTVRLIEMGRNVEHMDEAMAASFGSLKAAAYASGILVRNGVIVVVTCPRVKPKAEGIRINVDASDTPDFAAEKILDELAAMNMIALGASGYSPGEEEQIRRRLADLGYLE